MKIRGYFFLLLLILLPGCASTGGYKVPSLGQGYISVQDFCRKHNLEYSFDTVDDIVRIFSADVETQLMLNSAVGYHNGNIFSMNGSPFYVQGQIFLPNSVEEALYGLKDADLRVPFMVKTIVIDPGHGGKDPGAISPWGAREKDINLRVAKMLENELKTRGYRVILTRSRDMFLELSERVAVAKRYNADLFISVHANANKSRYMSGPEVYYLTPAKLDSVNRSLQLARSLGPWGMTPNFSARVILWDLMLTKSYSLSIESAQIVYSTLKNMSFSIKPPRAANYHVLRNAYTPAILVETGYLTNAQEARMLVSPNYQKQLAQALASAVVYLNKRHTDVAKKR